MRPAPRVSQLVLRRGLGNFRARILPSPPRLSDDLVARFRGLSSANLADAMGRNQFMDPEIRQRTRLPLCGPALTVYARPGDNLMVHKALQLVEPGDIVVVNTGDNRNGAVFGGMMCEVAVAAKAGGIIVDGAIRDVSDVERLRFPAYSRTVSIGSCDKDGPGEINVPISCGGTVVMPGDIVVGDADGIAVVPQGHAAEVLELVAKVIEYEKQRIAEIRGGNPWFPAIDATLRAKGIIGPS